MCAQRWIHFEVGVIRANIFIEQREVMGRNFAGYAQMVALGFANRAQSGCSGKMRDVVAPLGFRREANVTLNDRAFCFAGPATQSQTERCCSSVHHRTFSNAAIFCMLDHGKVLRRGGDQRFAHDPVAKNWLAVVAESNGAGALERREICELFTLASDGGSSN